MVNSLARMRFAVRLAPLPVAWVAAFTAVADAAVFTGTGPLAATCSLRTVESFSGAFAMAFAAGVAGVAGLAGVPMPTRVAGFAGVATGLVTRVVTDGTVGTGVTVGRNVVGGTVTVTGALTGAGSLAARTLAVEGVDVLLVVSTVAKAVVSDDVVGVAIGVVMVVGDVGRMSSADPDEELTEPSGGAISTSVLNTLVRFADAIVTSVASTLPSRLKSKSLFFRALADGFARAPRASTMVTFASVEESPVSPIALPK